MSRNEPYQQSPSKRLPAISAAMGIVLLVSVGAKDGSNTGGLSEGGFPPRRAVTRISRACAEVGGTTTVAARDPRRAHLAQSLGELPELESRFGPAPRQTARYGQWRA